MRYIETYKITDDNTLKQVFNGFIQDDESIIKKFCSTWDEMPPTMQGQPLEPTNCVVKIDDITYTLAQDGEEEKLAPYHSEDLIIEPMDGVKCLALLPGQEPYETRLKTDLKSLQMAVSDHREPSLIEYSFPFPEECIILGNEEAKLINMPLNREMSHEIYAGPIFIFKDGKNGELEDITEELVEKCLPKIRAIAEDEVIDRAPYLSFFGYFE